MSERYKKNRNGEFELDSDEQSASPPAVITRNDYQPAKRVRKVSPLGPRVMVRVLKQDNLSEGGLYLPEGTKENLAESVLAQVLEVASAHDSDTDEETNVSGIPFGATVLISKLSGTTVPWDDGLRIVSARDILALVEEVELT